MRILLAALLLITCVARAETPVPEPDPATTLTPDERASVTAEDAKELELALRVQSLLFRVQLDLEKRSPQKFSNDEWEALLKKSADDIIAAYEPAGLDAQKKGIVKKFLSALNWKAMAGQASALWKWGMGLARNHGLVFAGCQVIGTILGFAIPAAIAAAGMPVLAAIVYPIPMSDVLSVVGVGVQHVLLKRKLKKMYGPERYQQIVESGRIANKALSLRSDSDHIFPLDGRGTVSEGIVVSDWGLHHWPLEKMGISQERLHYWALKRVLAEHGYEDAFIKALDAETNHSPKEKAVLLLNHLVRTGRPDMIEAVRERFSHAFTLVDDEHRLSELLGWTRSFRDVKSLTDVRERLLKAPKGIPAYVIARLWHQEILPKILGRLDDVPWWKARRLDVQFHEVMAQAEKNRDAMWDDDWVHRVTAHFGKIVPVLNCFLPVQAL